MLALIYILWLHLNRIAQALFFTTEDIHSWVADLVDSHNVGLRHQNLWIVKRKKKSKNEPFQALFEESIDKV